MKKSKAVPLLLLGSTALLAGCTRGDTDQQLQQQVLETRQDAYSTIEGCDRDWVDDECVRSGSVYLGPRYFYHHGDGTPYVIDRMGRTRAMPSHYGAYNGYNGASGTPALSPDRTTIVTRNAASSGHSASISRGGFGGGRSSGSFGG
jgi:hypothetical protein